MGNRKRQSAQALKEAKKSLAFAKLNNCPTSPRKMRAQVVGDMPLMENIAISFQVRLIEHARFPFLFVFCRY